MRAWAKRKYRERVNGALAEGAQIDFWRNPSLVFLSLLWRPRALAHYAYTAFRRKTPMIGDTWEDFQRDTLYVIKDVKPRQVTVVSWSTPMAMGFFGDENPYGKGNFDPIEVVETYPAIPRRWTLP
jgi:hypothetical protein